MILLTKSFLLIMFRLAGRFGTQAEAQGFTAEQEKQARIATEKARLEAKMQKEKKEAEANRRIADKKNKTKAGVKATRMNKTSPRVNSLNKKKK